MVPDTFIPPTTEQERQRRESELRSQKDKQDRKIRLRKIWDSTSLEQQQAIIDHVQKTENSTIVRSFESKPNIREMYLLSELERRQ